MSFGKWRAMLRTARQEEEKLSESNSDLLELIRKLVLFRIDYMAETCDLSPFLLHGAVCGLYHGWPCRFLL